MLSRLHLFGLAAASLTQTAQLTDTFPGKRSTQNLVTVDVAQKYQQYDGMGFSEAFQRCRIIYGSDGLSAANTTRTLDLLFSDEVGAGLTILRNGIGSSIDNPYDLMKSIEPVSPGSPDSPPKYDWDNDDNGQLRLTKDAIARGVRSIYADAWSAPGYMKNNSNDSYGGYLCEVSGIDCATGDWRQAYANYLVQYLKYYAEAGIQIDHVGFLNEPDLNVTYASMLSSGQQAADFLRILYPTLKASGLNTSIACCDGSGWEQARELIQGIQAAGAEYTLDIATAHGYSSPLSTPIQTTKRVWQTEWADLTGAATLAWYTNGSTGEGLTWANNIQHAFAVSNTSAFLAWIGAGNTTTNSALILLHGDTVNVSKRLWAFAQFSRFVKPGAVRVGAAGAGVFPVGVNVTAFRNADGALAVQIINNLDRAEVVAVKGFRGGRGDVRAWLTDNENDLTEIEARRFGAGGAQAVVPGRSMVSFVGSCS